MTTQEILKIIEEEFEDKLYPWQDENYIINEGDFFSAVEKRLNTLDDKWEVGKTVRITKNIRGHHFKIGSIVTLTEFYYSDALWRGVDYYGNYWWITEEEGELIK